MEIMQKYKTTTRILISGYIKFIFEVYSARIAIPTVVNKFQTLIVQSKVLTLLMQSCIL